MRRSVSGFIAGVMLTLVGLIAGPSAVFAAPAPAHASSVAASLAGTDPANACTGYGQIAAWDLKRAGKKRADIGGIRFTKHPSLDIFCATTWSGSKTWHRKKPIMVKLGYYPASGGAATWPTVKGQLWDAGRYKQYAGGVWRGAPDNSCLAVRGKVVWKGKKYMRTIKTNRCS